MGPIERLLHTLVVLASVCAVYSGLTPPPEPSSCCSELVLSNLRVNYEVSPIDIDPATAPLLSWAILHSGSSQPPSCANGCAQRAYNINATITGASGVRHWTSGWVSSPETAGVAYEGPAVEPLAVVEWTAAAQVVGPDGVEGVISGSSSFQCDDKAWSATWIARGDAPPADDCAMYEPRPVPLFRKAFTTHANITSARLRVAYLGWGTVLIDGNEIKPESRFNTAMRDYSRRIGYLTFDVTASLAAGNDHAVSVELGNGWFNPLPMRFWGGLDIRKGLRAVGHEPALILELLITYADDSTQLVASGLDWMVTGGDVVRNNIYLGEVIDARRRMGHASFAAACAGLHADPRCAWAAAKPADNIPPSAELVRQAIPLVQIQRVLKPRHVWSDPTDPTGERILVDFGENVAGIMRLEGLTGPPGGEVSVRYGEVLGPDGGINVMTSVAGQIKQAGEGGPCSPDIAYQADVFVLAGSGQENFAPRYTWHGFRYAEVNVSALTAPLSPANFNLEVTRTDVERVGTFESDNDLYNQIHSMYVRSVESNLQGVQSDCPHRERFQYGGDILATAEANMLHWDMSTFYHKVLDDFEDAARPVNDTEGPNGFTETAPYVGIDTAGFGGGTGPVDWGSVQPLMAVYLALYYGNRQALKTAAGPARAYVDMLLTNLDKVRAGLGDWMTLEAPGKTTDLTGLVFLYLDLRAVSVMCEELGDGPCAQTYEQRAEDLVTAINSEFLDMSTGGYRGTGWSDTQVGQAVMLYYNLVPSAVREKALDFLRANIRAHNSHLQVGMFGVKWLFLSLSALGAHDDAAAMASQRDYPGYGYMLGQNATSLWESWGYSDSTFSHNHHMFGSIAQWLFSCVGGISVDVGHHLRPVRTEGDFTRTRLRRVMQPEGRITSRSFIIAPNPSKEVSSASSSYKSLYGPLAVRWKVGAGQLVMDVTIPYNTVATVVTPEATGPLVCRSQDGRAYSVDKPLPGGRYSCSAALRAVWI